MCLRISSWGSTKTHQKKFDNPYFILHQENKTFVTYLKDYKGVSGGGAIKSKGLLGTQGVGVNQVKEGSMYKMSSIWVLQLTKRIPSGVKCKCPQSIAIRPSKKS